MGRGDLRAALSGTDIKYVADVEHACTQLRFHQFDLAILAVQCLFPENLEKLCEMLKCKPGLPIIVWGVELNSYQAGRFLRTGAFPVFSNDSSLHIDNGIAGQ